MRTLGIVERLALMLSTEMPDVPYQLRAVDGGTELVIRSPSEAVGELVIEDQWDEVMVHIGTFAHSHWGADDHECSVDARPEVIARKVFDFITALLADEIQFYGTGAAGGYGPAGKPRGWWSRRLFGATTYRWSGPVENQSGVSAS